MKLDQLMQQFAQDMELGDITTQIPGVYVLPLEEEVRITISAAAGSGFSLQCQLAPCPKVKEEEFLTQAMLANLFGQGTRGGVLGLTEDGNVLTLSKVIENDLEYKDFKDIIEDFINAVDFWRDEAKSYS